jgi:hypothetical protein
MFSKTLDVSAVLFELDVLQYVPVFCELDFLTYPLNARL